MPTQTHTPAPEKGDGAAFTLINSLALNIEHHARRIRDAGSRKPWIFDSALSELEQSLDILRSVVSVDDGQSDSENTVDGDSDLNDLPGLYL